MIKAFGIYVSLVDSQVKRYYIMLALSAITYRHMVHLWVKYHHVIIYFYTTVYTDSWWAIINCHLMLEATDHLELCHIWLGIKFGNIKYSQINSFPLQHKKVTHIYKYRMNHLLDTFCWLPTFKSISIKDLWCELLK